MERIPTGPSMLSRRPLAEQESREENFDRCMPEAFTDEVLGMTSAFLWRFVLGAKVVDFLQVETSKGGSSLGQQRQIENNRTRVYKDEIG